MLFRSGDENRVIIELLQAGHFCWYILEDTGLLFINLNDSTGAAAKARTKTTKTFLHLRETSLLGVEEDLLIIVGCCNTDPQPLQTLYFSEPAWINGK